MLRRKKRRSSLKRQEYLLSLSHQHSPLKGGSTLIQGLTDPEVSFVSSRINQSFYSNAYG